MCVLRIFTIVMDINNKESKRTCSETVFTLPITAHVTIYIIQKKMSHTHACKLRILLLLCSLFKFKLSRTINSLKQNIGLEEGSCDTVEEYGLALVVGFCRCSGLWYNLPGADLGGHRVHVHPPSGKHK